MIRWFGFVGSIALLHCGPSPDASGAADASSDADADTSSVDATTKDASPSDAGAPGLSPLHVSGNHLVDASGKTVRLLGVNRQGEYDCVYQGSAGNVGSGLFAGPVDQTAVSAMVSWHVNSVRLTLNEDCWLGINGVNPAYGGPNYQNAIQQYVSLLHKNGLYVIVDLHFNAPGTHTAVSQQVMADKDHSIDFWSSVATTFKSDEAILFDLYNEPHITTTNAQTADPWTCWLHGCTITTFYPTFGSNTTVALSFPSAGMQDMLNAVRAAGAKQPVMVGGLAFANDLSGWLAHRPIDPLNSIVAAFHAYNFNACNGTTCWNSQIEPVAQSVPVVTGEFGQYNCLHDYADTYMGWADSNAISYLGWGWIVTGSTTSCANGPNLIAFWDGTPTPYGIGLHDHLALLAGK